MSAHDDKVDFYSFIDNVASQKGEDWFNNWSESNPITNFHTPLSDDEFSEMIMDPETDFSLIDYRAMKEKLESDIRGH